MNDGPVQIGPAYQARHETTCCYCLKPIDIGDWICRVDNHHAHETCVDHELWWNE